jgi:hypothetical protein
MSFVSRVCINTSASTCVWCDGGRRISGCEQRAATQPSGCGKRQSSLADGGFTGLTLPRGRKKKRTESRAGCSYKTKIPSKDRALSTTEQLPTCLLVNIGHARGHTGQSCCCGLLRGGHDEVESVSWTHKNARVAKGWIVPIIIGKWGKKIRKVGVNYGQF